MALGESSSNTYDRQSHWGSLGSTGGAAIGQGGGQGGSVPSYSAQLSASQSGPALSNSLAQASRSSTGPTQDTSDRFSAHLRFNISDRTSRDGLTKGAYERLDAAQRGADVAGLDRIEVKAGAGGGHRSHQGGTEVDIMGYNADGSKWTREQRLMVAQAAREGGADRFGLYEYGKSRPTADGRMHIGKSGRGRPAALWGAGGRMSGARSRQYNNPNEVAFLNAVQSGSDYEVPGLETAPEGQRALANLWGRETFMVPEAPPSPPANPRNQPRYGADGARSMMGYAPQPQTGPEAPFEAVMEPSQEVDIPLPQARPERQGFDMARFDAAGPPQAPGIPTPQPRPAPEGFDVGRFDAAAPGPTFDPAPEQGQQIVVQAGDSLWAIAHQYLGDGRRWQEIAQANGITDPNALQIGQNLIIPGQTQVADIPDPRLRPRLEAQGVPTPPINPNRAEIMDPAERQRIMTELDAFRREEAMRLGEPSFVSSNGVRIWVEQ